MAPTYAVPGLLKKLVKVFEKDLKSSQKPFLIFSG